MEHDFAIYKDGNQFCAVAYGFRNLQEDDAGFGDTPETALAALLKRPATDVSALREAADIIEAKANGWACGCRYKYSRHGRIDPRCQHHHLMHLAALLRSEQKDGES